MAQQINLYTPILLTPVRVLSARRMAVALGGLAVVLALCCAALLAWQSYREREHSALTERQQLERQQLSAALKTTRERLDPTLLAQQQQALQRELAELRQQAAQRDRQQLPPGQHHSTWLALLARSTPEPVWLTSLRLAPDQIELGGLTLDPGALQAWMRQLATEPTLPGQRWAQVQVEQLGARLPAGAASLLPGTRSDAPPRLPTWQFRIATPAPAGGPAAHPEARP